MSDDGFYEVKPLPHDYRPFNPASDPAHRRFAQYCQYVRNTGRVILAAADFDDDWAPIGPSLRRDMEAAGLIAQEHDALYLTDLGETLTVNPNA